LLSSSLGNKGQIIGSVRNDKDGDGAIETGEGGLNGVRVFIDSDRDGTLDPTERTTTTNTSGKYTFPNLNPGKYSVMVVNPGGFRSTRDNPVLASVVAALTKTVNFPLSQTVILAGVVFNDLDDNGILDSTDGRLGGVKVFLDFNDNGQLDEFEVSDVTDSKGNYRFVLPFGTYVVRQVTPSGFQQTSPDGSITLTLNRGKVSKSNHFANVRV
ncbi:MAG: SdrD B-like domain-containing protein, partial [Tepidisphaeraceae bacterium]